MILARGGGKSFVHNVSLVTIRRREQTKIQTTDPHRETVPGRNVAGCGDSGVGSALGGNFSDAIPTRQSCAVAGGSGNGNSAIGNRNLRELRKVADL
jgi:hypothetical protein